MSSLDNQYVKTWEISVEYSIDVNIYGKYQSVSQKMYSHKVNLPTTHLLG